MMKFAFNFTVMGQPVGPQNKNQQCLPGSSATGSVRVSGDAESNADQGSSFVNLSYDLKNCFFSAPRDPMADQTTASR
jgi:hypothetical protein